MKPNKQKLIVTERVLKNGLIGFGRNAWLAVAAIAMMAVTLTILLFLIVANATLNTSVKDITNKIDVVVYLNDSDTSAQVQSLTSQLQALPNTQSVHYTSKSDALEAYRAQNANNVDLLEAISETNNPLPADLEIHPKDTNQLQSIKIFLDQPAIQTLYSSTSYSGSRQQAVDKITHVARFFQRAGVIGIAIFVVVSMMIIFNTIRMAIFNRREELTIMRLLGATTWYIRGPFVVETMIYGIIAAVISTLVCWVLFVSAGPSLTTATLDLVDIGYAKGLFTNHLLLIVFGQIFAGMLIGAISSTIATRRYLKFKSV